MREVTERDFRLSEFRDADPKDYEFRADGKIVRKDRWETGIHKIKNIIDPNSREFEIDELIEKVRENYQKSVTINADLIEALSWALEKLGYDTLSSEDDKELYDSAKETLERASETHRSNYAPISLG